MELESFVANFAAQYDEADPSEFTPDAEFRNIGEWSSIIALCVIAMIDEEYNVAISGDDIIKSNTIRDLFEIVKSRC
jgi:acyl carrier protein